MSCARKLVEVSDKILEIFATLPSDALAHPAARSAGTGAGAGAGAGAGTQGGDDVELATAAAAAAAATAAATAAAATASTAASTAATAPAAAAATESEREYLTRRIAGLRALAMEHMERNEAVDPRFLTSDKLHRAQLNAPLVGGGFSQLAHSLTRVFRFRRSTSGGL